MSAVTKWEHYLWWNNWKKLNLGIYFFPSGVSWNTTGVFETNKLRFGTSNFVPTNLSILKVVNSLAPLFKKVTSANIPHLQSHFILRSSIAILISRVRSRWVKKESKLRHPFCNQYFFLALPPIPFGGGGTQPEQHKRNARWQSQLEIVTLQIPTTASKLSQKTLRNLPGPEASRKRSSWATTVPSLQIFSFSDFVFCDPCFRTLFHERAYRMTLLLYIYTYWYGRLFVIFGFPLSCILCFIYITPELFYTRYPLKWLSTMQML